MVKLSTKSLLSASSVDPSVDYLYIVDGSEPDSAKSKRILVNSLFAAPHESLVVQDGDDAFKFYGREGIGWGVPIVRSEKVNAVTAFDVSPNGTPTGAQANTGLAWIHVLNSDIEADADNWEALLLAARSDKMVVGAMAAGTGTVRPLNVAGSSIVFQSAASGSPTAYGQIGAAGWYLGDPSDPHIWSYSSESRIDAAHALNWASGSTVYSTRDVGVKRQSAGVLRVTDASTGRGDLEVGDLNSSGGVVVLSSLPTTDPTSAGQLWNDGGTLKVSAG